MRPNEFKLRQRTGTIPARHRDTIKRLIREGTSKKVLCQMFNCTYEYLKEYTHA